MTVLDRERLDTELQRRGLSARRLAVLAGLTETTISRARSGKPVSATTARTISQTLAAVPPLAVDLLAEVG